MTFKQRSIPASLLAILACAAVGGAAADTVLPPVLAAVRSGNCASAVDLVNKAASANDARTLFWGARMMDEGICVEENHQDAARFYAHAAQLGDAGAGLEYAAVLGQGRQADQSYELAGDACKAADVDAAARLGSYTLGYVCTLQSMASRYVREQLPQHPFAGELQPPQVEFQPRSGALRLVSVPRIALEAEPPTGSNRRRPKVDIRRLLAEAWDKAVAATPKPDAARLDDRPVNLLLDIDVTLEEGAPAADASGKRGSVPLGLSPDVLWNPPHPVGTQSH